MGLWFLFQVDNGEKKVFLYGSHITFFFFQRIMTV